jgi:endonuclease/exonuclease/phosphatase family metal-dependent hydrolase
MDLQVATYNVHGFPWISVPIKQIANWITKNCDLVALQEVWSCHTEWSAAFAANGWVFLHPARESHFATLFGSGLAFAWPSGRWALRDSRQYPFLTSMGLDMLATKGWFRIDLIDNHTGHPLRVINTHLQADVDVLPGYFKRQADSIRLNQARQLVKQENGSQIRSRTPTLLIGDMNTDKNIFDGFTMCPSEEAVSEFTGIDRCGYVKEQLWTVLDWHTANEANGWSDHLPIVWRLHIP